LLKLLVNIIIHKEIMLKLIILKIDMEAHSIIRPVIER